MRGKTKVFIFITAVACGLLLIGVSAPLVKKNVGPNSFYGIRFDESYQSDQHWYAINHYGGWALIWAGVGIVVANIILFLFRTRLSPLAYAGFFMGIMMAALLAATIFSAIFAKI